MIILIFSDTHGNVSDPIDIIKNEPIVDLIIHAGDCIDDANKIHAAFPELPMLSVPGNCDFGYSGLYEISAEIGGIKIFVTHGHRYGVKMCLSSFLKKAEEENADLAVYGHTHISDIDYHGKTTVINPGTMHSYDKTYARAEVSDGKIKADIIKYSR